MVGIDSIIFIIITFVLSVIMPIILIIYGKRKYKIDLKYAFVGIIAFIVSTQLLEAPLHHYFLYQNEKTSQILTNPIFYMIYAGLMAGIFEESARYISFRWILKKNKSYKNSVAYGIGHGGIEAVLVAGVMYFNNIIAVIQINNRTFDNLINAASGTLKSSLTLVKTQLINAPSYTWGIAGIERVCTIIIQIGLSMLIFYSIKERKRIYFFLGILLHAVVDFVVALYQIGSIKNIAFVEEYLILIAVITLIIIYKKRKIFINTDDI